MEIETIRPLFRHYQIEDCLIRIRDYIRDSDGERNFDLIKNLLRSYRFMIESMRGWFDFELRIINVGIMKYKIDIDYLYNSLSLYFSKNLHRILNTKNPAPSDYKYDYYPCLIKGHDDCCGADANCVYYPYIANEQCVTKLYNRNKDYDLEVYYMFYINPEGKYVFIIQISHFKFPNYYDGMIVQYFEGDKD